MEESILGFWFGSDVDSISQEHYIRWFTSDTAFDQEIAQRFGKLHKAATKGAFHSWCETPRGRLALLILLDQFSRNLYRDNPLSWAQDDECQTIASDGVERGQDKALHPVERIFFYMPFQHSEQMAHQDLSVRLYEGLCTENPDSTFARNSLEYATYHRELVSQFGRFPHRNRVLGRETTEAEQAYLDALPEGKVF